MDRKIEPYEGEQPYIFVSYSHQDSDQVLEILNRLAQMGYRIWYDEGIEWGTEWPDNIAQHLVNSSAFLAFHSKNSAKSANCRREIFYATRNSKPIFSVFLEEVQFPPGLEMELSLYQSSNYYQYPEDQKDDFFNRIKRTSILSPSRKKLEVKSAEELEPINKEETAASEKDEIRETTKSVDLKETGKSAYEEKESTIKKINIEEIKKSQAEPNNIKTSTIQVKKREPSMKLDTKVSSQKKNIGEENVLIKSVVNKPKRKHNWKLIIGLIPLFFIILIFGFFLLILNQNRERPIPVISEGATTTATNLYSIGSTYTFPDQGISITLDSVQEHTGKAANVKLPDEGNVYLIFTYTVSKQNGSPTNKNLFFQGYLNGSKADNIIMNKNPFGSDLDTENIPVGSSVTGTRIYEVPKDWKEFSEKVRYVTDTDNEYAVVFYVMPSQVTKVGGEVE